MKAGPHATGICQPRQARKGATVRRPSRVPWDPLAGPRGVGKTTTARLLAMGLNCERPRSAGPVPCAACDACREVVAGRALDVMEIDGASNRGIDEVRALRENARYAPARARRKVYI